MYIKVFAHGKGRGELATEYLVNEKYPNRDTRPPTVLRGDVELTTKLINSLETTWKYTSGVLSWHPDDKVNEEQEMELMDEFEKMAFAGIEPDQYNILWVRHTHANHHELHFVIPRMELSTGKAFNPCPPGWQKHFDPLRDYFNIKENWARPDAPERQRLFTPPQAEIKYNRLKRWGKEITKSEVDEIRELLIDYTINRIENGMIENRADIINSFQELGLEINRQGKDYITVHDKESDKKIRLKGGIFNENWRIESKNTAEITKRSRDAGADPTSELERLGKKLTKIHASRSKYNRKQYANNRKSHKITYENQLESQTIQLLSDDTSFNGLDFGDISSEQEHKHLFDKQNKYTANTNRELGTGTANTHENLTEITNMGNTNLRGQERPLPCSATRNDSQPGLESWRTKGHQNRNEIGEENERNTTIFAKNIRELGTKYKPENRLEQHGNQELTKPIGKIAKTAKQLGAIFEQLAYILQQIAKFIPDYTRKIEQTERAKEVKREDKQQSPRMRM